MASWNEANRLNPTPQLSEISILLYIESSDILVADAGHGAVTMANSMQAMFKVDDQTYAEQENSPAHIVRREFLERVIRENILLGGKRGFDFGAGYGATMRSLETNGAIMTGCDISPVIAAKNPNVQVGSLNVLERIKPQDFIICAMVLALMQPDERERFWQLAREKTVPGGLVFVLSGNARRSPARKTAVLGLPDPERYPGEIARHGFALQALRYSRIMPGKIGRLLRRCGIAIPDRLDNRGMSKAALNDRAFALLFVFRRSAG